MKSLTMTRHPRRRPLLAALTLIAVLSLAACGPLTLGNLRITFGQQRTPRTVVIVPNTNPVPDHLAKPSQNWAGYARVAFCGTLDCPMGTGVSAISATWQVPQTLGPANSDSSTWIGVGGVNSNSLIQAGTDQYVQHGKSHYYAWIETLPQLPQPLNEIDLLPGDMVTVTISRTGPQQWSIQIVDHDANESVSRSISYPSCACSGEWIEEAPSVNNQQTQLADFKSVTFTQCSITLDGLAQTPADVDAHAIRMVDSLGSTIVVPQVLDGDAFSVVDIQNN